MTDMAGSLRTISVESLFTKCEITFTSAQYYYSHYFIECARVYSDGIHFSTCVPISFSFALFDMNTLLIHKMSSSFTFYSSPLAACMPIFSLNASTNVCFLLMFISIRQIKLIVFSLFRLSAMWGVEALPIPNSYEKILSLYKMNINPFCSIYIEYCGGVCVCVCSFYKLNQQFAEMRLN